VRSPTDLPPRPRRLGRVSRRLWIGIAIVVVLIVFFSLRNIAVLWTDQMWFSSVGLSSVFSTLFLIKVGLGLTFGAVFFFILWGNLLLTDRFGARDLSFEPEDEVVRRFQNAVRPYAKRVYAAIALVVGLIGGLNATGEWQNYILFAHSRPFAGTDPLFHENIGFYVFTLPFISFCATWLLVVLIVTLIITAVFHFLNGGIRATNVTPRVAPRVKAHLSVIGAGIAIMKAVGYLLARWDLVLSTNGFTQGAGYTDVHARIPALTILFYLSLAAAAILLYNVRSRGWSLPAVAVGLWAFVALVIGVLYPTFLQALKVSPNQETLEAPYIQRDINATRSAYNLDTVQYHSFSGSAPLSAGGVKANLDTLKNIRLWDPANNISLNTVTRRQAERSYYSFPSLAVDRYYINGKLTPVLIGTRQINESSLPNQTWVSQHLVYTHGNGVAVVAANQVDAATGNPIFDVGNVPPESSGGLPVLTQPGIYFGLNESGWVVADTKQPELNYQVNSGPNAGTPVYSHYKGGGGVPVGGIFSRLALALRLGNFNFLISNQIASNSRVMFVRDVRQMAQKAAPFLTFDSQPYPIIANGHVDYVLNGYTTTTQYPYSENADQLTSTTGALPGSFNYVRNSVVAVVDAYTGSIHFYVIDPRDPIIQAYRSAFPSMFQPVSAMPTTVRDHLRYPSDLLGVQAAVLGRYHIITASSFYAASDRWEVTPTTGAGSPKALLQSTQLVSANGQIISSTLTPMSPIYQVGALPGSSTQQLLAMVDYVPAGNSSQIQGLTAILTATSDPTDYGQLNVYETARGTTVNGPLNADSEIEQDSKVSSITTLLGQNGSEVLLGNNLTIPLGSSLLYVRPLYVTSTSNPMPELRYVITVFNQQVGIEPTLAGALKDVLGPAAAAVGGAPASSGGTPTGGGTSNTGGATSGATSTAQTYLNRAASDYTAAQNALASGDLGAYQRDVEAMDHQLVLAQKALSAG
jgi:uncharacterized protein